MAETPDLADPELLLFGEPAENKPWMQWLLLTFWPLLLTPLILFHLLKRKSYNIINTPGFEVVTNTEKRLFIPLTEKYQPLDFVNKIQTLGTLRLSSNLNKVYLSIRRYGYLLEDKNFRNALLVNRRRLRRTLLKNNDLLDLGDLTLLYRDNRDPAIMRYSALTPQDGKTVIKFQRHRGPVRKGTPMLTSDQFPNRVFFITKNMVYIGRSESNDLVVKSPQVQFRHAKIERVGGRYKLQDLTMTGQTFVNNRRVELRFLKDGDEIALENNRFKFSLATRAIRERPPLPESSSQDPPPSADRNNWEDETAML